jgi:integrase/recombinase XerD
MTPIQDDARDYLEWMGIHNYATMTIQCRKRYLGYFATFAEVHEVTEAKDVTLELLLAYQQNLYAHRKSDGEPLSFGTQAQRLVPVVQFFSWIKPREVVSLES